MHWRSEPEAGLVLGSFRWCCVLLGVSPDARHYSITGCNAGTAGFCYSFCIYYLEFFNEECSLISYLTILKYNS